MSELREIPYKFILQIAGLLFAAGITFSAIRNNTAAIEGHKALIKEITAQVNEHESVLAQNVTEHQYIIKSLDRIEETLSKDGD